MARIEPADTPIKELGLLARTARILQDQSLKTLGDVAIRSEAELLRAPGFGRKSLNDVKGVLARNGFRLAKYSGEFDTVSIPPQVWNTNTCLVDALTRFDAVQMWLDRLRKTPMPVRGENFENIRQALTLEALLLARLWGFTMG
jgi:hypothetical protein